MAAEFYVSPTGRDTNSGTATEPFATIAHARDVVRKSPRRTTEPIRVILRGGVYYQQEPLVFTAADSGAANAGVEYCSAEGEEVVVSGGVAMTGLKWKPFCDGIMRARMPAGFTTDQLFVNGEQMPMARYPNYSANAHYFGGTAADAFSDERAARWDDPAGGFMHAMHSYLWGGMHYQITGKDKSGSLVYEGGWQNNRSSSPHKKVRFVENIFEELDAPGEWFLDTKKQILYFYPPEGLDLAKAKLVGVRLRHLVEFRGTEQNPVRFLALKGITFRHAARTFMDNKERMLRTDWTVYRGAAVFLNGTEDCRVEDCRVTQVGGNAIFVNNYNRRVVIRGCEVYRAGGNGISFVGDQAAVRDGLVQYKTRTSFDKIDKTPGPKTNNYPADSLVEECLIHKIGLIEKQTAGVEIDMAMHITVRQCSIYDMPRAGINIGDGCWGGHIVEFCDVFDTVLETGDHGSFNSWGRDRFWGLKGIDLNTITLGEHKNLPLLDVIHPIILRNNRWRCDHGWDIDLDDGSSNYQLRNNLCLNGGIKNREGFYRTVENNIMVNNGFHPHVWYGNCQDVFRRNIVFKSYRPARMSKTEAWGKEMDYNLIHSRRETSPATPLSKASRRDEHSIMGDAQFIDPLQGDYRVKEGSPALELGFVNFPMDRFGVTLPRLRAMARTPKLPGSQGTPEQKVSTRDPRAIIWLGATLRNIVGLGDISAAGLPGEIGVNVLDVSVEGVAAQSGLKVGDVILKCGGEKTDSLADFQRILRTAPGTVRLQVWRNQASMQIDVVRD